MNGRPVPNAESLWTDPTLDDLDLAILCTVAYADVFDYALTAEQIHRYLVGMGAGREDVHRALSTSGLIRARCERNEDYFTLAGRGGIVDLRRRRAVTASQMWPRAVRYGQAIAALPFVRGIALTGALAMGNVDPGDDFDFLIVTAVGRLWLTRAMVIALVVRPAARRGNEVCPNYLLSEGTFDFQEQNLYVAHELAQMVPLAGLDIYWRIRRVNDWMTRFLPNAGGLPRTVDPAGVLPASRRPLAEVALNTFVGRQLERFERRRKIRRFTAQSVDAETACFSAVRCKGHFISNEQPILEAFDERLRELRRV